MASGNIVKAFGDYSTQYELRIAWSSTSNINSNTSIVKATVSLYCPYSLYIASRTGNTITINGKVYSFDTKALNTSSSATFTLATITSDAISHNSNGSKSITISSSFKLNASLGGDYFGTVTASGTAKLDNIPRAATLTSAPNFDDEDNPVIKYSNPAGNAVETLQAAIYNSDGSKALAAYRNITKTGTSYTFSLTATERNAFRNNMRNSKSTTVRFYIRTVIGDNTYTSYLSKTFIVVNAEPTINPTVTDINPVTEALTGDSNTLIRYFSNAAITFGESALKGATIESKSVVNGSKTLSNNGTLNEVESGSFKFTVTDSRGYSTTETVNKPIVNYIRLTCGLSNTNFNTDGLISFRIKGNYFNGTFGTTSNVLIIQYRYKLSGGSYGDWISAEAAINGNKYTADVVISGLDYRSKYVIQARALDELDIISSSEKTLSCVPVFDWGESDFSFNVPVNMGENVHFENGGTGIRGTTTDGVDVQCFSPCNTNNNCVVGYGGYTEEVGGTNIYGNEVRIISNASVYVNGMEIAENKVLWSGEYYMTENQTATLTEVVSKQATGIVLVFSRYNPGEGVLNEQFNYHFVPKQIVALQNGKGSIFPMSTSNETFAASKYLYIYDDKIAGHANNDATGTGNNGITYTNNRFVLRYVIGV